MRVKPKKSLGQHFLKDQGIALDIVNALEVSEGYPVFELGPGTGVLTQYLMTKNFDFAALDIDQESIAFLHTKYPNLNVQHGDFLKLEIDQLIDRPFALIGNFPYNISSQIFFKVLDHKDQVTQVVCMLQKEVADRIVSPPGKKAYGILSVFLQAYYDMEKLFDVEPMVFDPPPKVWSSVIRLKRNQRSSLDCDESLFRKVVKTGFQMRRKTLRNALKGLNLPPEITALTTLNLRAEQLSVSDFEKLTQLIEKHG